MGLKDELNDQFGKKMVDGGDLKALPTGILSFDVSTGVGGLPRGRYTEIFGYGSSGKTTLALEVAKQARKLGESVLYVDVEHSLDEEYASRFVGDFGEEFIIARPKDAETALEIIEFSLAHKPGLIVLDSVAALSPQKEQSDELTDHNVALRARILSKFFSRTAYRLYESQTVMLMLNQIRDNIGTYFGGVISPGGRAIQFYSSLRVSLSSKKDAKNEEGGSLTKFSFIKNKVGIPGRTFEVPLVYGVGYDKTRDAIDFGIFAGVVQLRGSYYKFDDIQLGQGIKQAIAYLDENGDVLDKIKEMCYNRFNIKKGE
jgi:recombination protein RecA